MTNDLLTPKEVAILLRVDRNTIYRWLRQGKLRKIILPGGQIRIKRKDINELCQNVS